MPNFAVTQNERRLVAFGPEFGKIVGNELIIAIGLKYIFRIKRDGLPVSVYHGIAMAPIGLMHHHQFGIAFFDAV